MISVCIRALNFASQMEYNFAQFCVRHIFSTRRKFSAKLNFSLPPPPRAFPATTLLIITLCNRIDVCAVVCSYQMPDVCCVLYHILPQVFGIQNYWNYFVTMCPLLLIVMHCGYFVADFFAFLNLPINKWVSL